MSAGPSHPGAPLPQPLRRARDGRWLGGVCRGMANRWSTPVGQLRALFAVATLFGGLGLLAYAACWLVLPTDAEEDSPSLLRALASVALLAAAAAGLTTIALVAAVATLFGFGWAVAVGIGAFLAGALVLLPAAKPAWVLPPLIAAALPAIAVAASGAELMPHAGLRSERPERAAAIPSDGYRTGLGDLFVDLRELRVAPGAIVPLKLDTGVGRTVVALPHDRCFDVELTYATEGDGWRVVRSFADALGIGGSVGGNGAILYGGWVGGSGRWTRRSDDPRAPTLRIDYSTLGGELWLRDYPPGVGPLATPWWPYDGTVGDERRLRELERGACAPGAAERAAAARAAARARRA
ncbi:PspC domain-containing protein, partial [Conexibacter stalactiti]